MSCTKHEKLISYVENQILVGRQEIALSASDDLLSSGLVDSLAIMRLVGFVEKEFNCKVPPQDLTVENFMTIDAICQYLSMKSNL